MSLPLRPDPSRLRWPVGASLVLVVVVALLVGLQLGAVPWRFRRQMLQLQGALAGGAVGMVVGYALGRRRRQP
ncbi:hypothetical protein KBZ12_03830 [Cyanobium sp. Cruz CV13-4-11]|jgi:hypothetical protein|uniref:hypothetical protein n=1 Tax=unclassified Cyanobium TaxID=2627006 RepID=UPI0020CE47DB|nr:MULTISPECIES: hypothetical protein [unclassified Cyanobium]MCP9901575.1 hypothetical protein [Cyanobium sp. Cruz CV11-17]MCP9918618.1 hypothetical protein [Cyanobium sp. Cruz CV13-4-11]